jgi:hypothetical protein
MSWPELKWFELLPVSIDSCTFQSTPDVIAAGVRPSPAGRIGPPDQGPFRRGHFGCWDPLRT